MQMRGRQISLDKCACPGRISQKVDMHFVRANLRAFMAQTGEIQRHGAVLSIAESQSLARAIPMTPYQDKIGLRQGRAADERIYAVEIPSP